MTLLGSAADSALSQGVEDSGLRTSHAQVRATAAIKLTGRICDFAQSAVCSKSFHMAWTLLTKSVIHALDYDAKLISAVHLQGVAQPLYDAIGKAATMLSGAGLRPVHVEQMSLPGHFSGCGARNLAVSPYADVE